MISKETHLILDHKLPAGKSNDGFMMDEAFEMSGKAGTVRYMAPEVALDKPFNLKAGVYSFSIVLFEILTGKTFGSQYDEGSGSFSLAVHHSGLRPHIDYAHLPCELREVVKDGWANKHVERLDIKEIHQVLKEQHFLASAAAEGRNYMRTFRWLNSRPSSTSLLDVNRRRKDYEIQILRSIKI
mmetsp:Transcript_21837/g.30786  ORF Transcript_21837/g.30786 Transcript_21837/m.30786 type:complete len:184 (-) Transcript_21837:1327-1878(-)